MFVASLALPWVLLTVVPVFPVDHTITDVASVHSAPIEERLISPLPQPPPDQSAGRSALERQEEYIRELEIKKLEMETATTAQWRAWLPIGSILVAIAAATIGAYQYRKDARRNSEIRVQEQYAENIERLVGHIDSENRSSARVVSALDNLSALVSLTSDPEARTSNITGLVLTEVVDDLNFEDLRQVRFDALCLQHWADYSDLLDKQPKKRDFILYRYRQALRVLANRHADYFSTIRFDPESGFVVQEFIEEADYLLFTRLVDGYRTHVERLIEDQREQAIQAFTDVLRNPDLANDLFRTASGQVISEPKPNFVDRGRRA